MKTTQTKDIMTLIKQCLLCFMILLVSSCFKYYTNIPPKAEITNIYNITESSATVDVKVTKQSNANYVVDFHLSVDTIGNPYNVQTINLIDTVVNSLNNSYTTVISKLKSKTLYSLSLYFYGNFDTGGPNQGEWQGFTIGATKTFTTK
jgi:hypothetical protein